MKKITLIAGVLVLAASFSFAGVKTYQVTGPIVSVTDTSIVVQKGKDQWEIARDAATKVTGDLKVGEKVTIQYTMTATTVEVKPSKTSTTVQKVSKAANAAANTTGNAATKAAAAAATMTN